MNLINFENFQNSLSSFGNSGPFDHCIIDNFFNPGVAEVIEAEFLDYDNPSWFYYKNPIEDKKALNDWNKFPKNTYQAFCELMSGKFVASLSNLINAPVYIDHGLHGGGWHMHGPGGNLNPHLDYSIHPKMGLLRKLNIIVYLSSSLQADHGGHLGLWSHSSTENSPSKLVTEIEPKFNRAVLFDTTQDSWHGMSRPLTQPEGIFRKSLAIYYLTDPNQKKDNRERALFAPRESQKDNKEISDLIKLRADSVNFHKAYRK